MNDLIIPLLIVIFGIISLEIGVAAPILEIIAGLVGANIFQLSDIPWMDFIANFGILGLMFFAGLEVDKDILRKNAGKGAILGLASYLIPFTVISLVGFILLSCDLKTAALIGISLSTTSVALVYPVLKDLKLLSSEVGQTIFTGAVLVDVLSMVSLTIIFGSITYWTMIFFILTILFMYHAPKIGSLLFKRYRGNLAEIELKFLSFILISLIFFSNRVGVEEAILAFILGFLFSEILEEHEEITEKLRGIVFGFMSPIFFFKAGTLMKLSGMRIYVAILMMVFLPIAFIAKYFSANLVFSRLAPEWGKRSKLVGAIFNFRLTFGLISAIFGLQHGILTSEIYTAIVGTVITTSLISSMIIRMTENEQSTLKRARGDSNPRPPA
ncbi:MAG TPA: cation:proton antiporter [Nitrososphaeria archaeon]|nr:MAG: hypothetical protein DRN68_04110 [Nitrososphaerota archaeon]HDJ66547.1 cation:proton antiporter [Nitrososphaeria archaeon]